MFCPKCGTQNPETGKFCRSCGTDVSNVPEALTGKSGGKSYSFGLMEPIQPLKMGSDDAKRRTDPNEVYADAIKSILSGIGFVIISMILLFTNVARGSRWWWAMLFPAFTFLAKGISDYLKSRKMEATQAGFSSQSSASFNQPSANATLPPSQTEYVAPESRFKTGDLIPSSVTDGTTKHLEINSEGETMTLPKR